MKDNKTPSMVYLRIFVHTLIAWTIVLVVQLLLIDASSWLFVLGHYIAAVIVFGYSFRLFFKTEKKLTSYHVTLVALTFFLFAEAVYWIGFYNGEQNYLNFVNWMLPAFLIVSTIYMVGFTKQKKLF